MLRLFGTLAVVLLGSAGTPREAPDVAREILRRERCQPELPVRAPASGRPDRLATGPEWPPPPGGGVTGLPGIPAVLAVVVAGILLALGLAWMRRGLPSGRPGLEGASEAPVRLARRPRPAPGIREAESLARQQRFGEAIHALGLGVLGELERRARGPAAPASLTSREVLRHAALPSAEAGADLAFLVAAVERAHFGGRSAGPEDWAACSAHYGRLRQAWRGGA